MKYKELFIMLDGLKDINSTNAPTNFLYAVTYNKRELVIVLEDVQPAIKPSDDFTKYDGERKELLTKYASKDSEGNVITEEVKLPNGTVDSSVRIENLETFNKDLVKLDKKFSKALIERTKQVKDYNEFLETESKFKPEMIKKSDLPKTGLSQKAMDSLIFMIKK